jgi:hypothetical protein
MSKDVVCSYFLVREMNAWRGRGSLLLEGSCWFLFVSRGRLTGFHVDHILLRVCLFVCIIRDRNVSSLLTSSLEADRLSVFVSGTLALALLAVSVSLCKIALSRSFVSTQ